MTDMSVDPVQGRRGQRSGGIGTELSAGNDTPARTPRRQGSASNGSDSSRRGLTFGGPGGGEPTPEQAAEELELKYGASHVIKLFIPVSLCMFLVVVSISTISFYTKTDQYLVYTPFTDQTVDTTTKLWQSFANAGILLIVIIIMTVVLIFLYKSRCYRVIHGWLFLSSFMLLTLFMFIYVSEVLRVYNIPLDWLSLALLMWNFAVVGMICIHWKGPLFLQQAYLIVISALMALVFIKYLPDWTAWVVLGVISIWDLVAVLCPKGPLRILVETAQERNEPIFPALIYSSAMAYFVGSTNESGDERERTQEPQDNNGGNSVPSVNFSPGNNHERSRTDTDAGLLPHADDDEKGVKLGLGDFISTLR